MINFRYHVVSLTAVFLALAIGLVVGTAALNGPLADRLNDTVNALGNQNKQLRDKVTHMEEEVNRQEDFAVEAAPFLLAGKLATRRVAVVSLPSAARYVDGVVEMLGKAGAKVTGRVEITDRFTDPGNNVPLLDLAHDAVMPPSVTADLPRNSDGVETSSALLAAVLVDRRTGAAVPAADRTLVLSEYESDGYIAYDEQIAGPAEAVIVVAGDPYFDREAPKKNAASLTLVTQFDEATSIVLAGTGVAGTGNLVAEVREDPALSKTVSTIDNVNTAQGRISTVLALGEQLRPAGVATPKAGHYGISAGSLMPKWQQ